MIDIKLNLGTTLEISYSELTNNFAVFEPTIDRPVFVTDNLSIAIKYANGEFDYKE